MIVDTLVTLLFGLLDTVLTFASWPGQLSASLSSTSQTIGSALHLANNYFPVITAMILILAGLVFDLACTAVQFVLTIYRAIPLKAT